MCRSSSGAEAGSQTLNQLMLPAPATSNGSAIPAKVDPKWDLLSGDTYDSPKADTSLALVPLGEQHAASPVSDQNALVLFDMFSNGDNASTPVNTQPTQQTNVAGQSGPFTPQFQQQHTFISQGGLYPNGSVPNAGSPQYEQSPHTQSTGPAWNAQIPNGSVPNSGSHQYEQSLHTQSTGPAWNGQVAEQQQPASPYGNISSSDLNIFIHIQKNSFKNIFSFRKIFFRCSWKNGKTPVLTFHHLLTVICWVDGLRI